MGHSVGEYVAACVAGVFSLEDGLRLIAERGRLMQALPPGGTMAAIFAPAADVAAVVAPFSNTLSIAAINAGDSVVISGAADAVEHVLAAFEQRKIKGHRLYISLAAHSPLVEPALDAMEACARQVEMQLPRIPVAWNLTGTTSLSTGAPDARYWRRHLREPVRFADGVAALHRDGYSTFLEVGPHPTLIALAQRSLPEDVLFLTSLRRGKDDWHELMTSVARLYVHGGPIDWRGVERSFNGRRVSLPTYPFERRSYWIGSAPSGTRHMPNAINRQGGLAGARLATAAPIFELVLTPDSPAYLAEHRAHGAVLVAGPVYMEMAQACAREAFGAASRSIDDFSIHQPLVVPDEGRAVQVQFAASSERSTHGTGFEIHSRAMNGNGDWQLHASGRLLAAEPSPGRRDESPLVTPAHEASSAEYYARLLKLGIDLRDSFRSLRDVRRVDGHVVARIELAGSRAADRIEWAHPALLDGALQAVGLALRPSEGSDLFLFTGVEHVQLQGPLPASLMCEARLREPETPQSRQLLADVVLYDSSGKRLGEIRGVSLRRTTREALAKATGVDSRPDTSYQVAWEPVPISAAAAGALVDPSHYVPRLTSRFEPLAGEQGMAIYDDLLPELDRISLTHIRIALDELGFDARVGRTFRVRDEAARLGIVERQQRLFARLMQILAEDGLLRLDGDEYMVATAAPASDPGRLYDAAFERFGDVDGELRTLHRCGAALARVLRGAQDPVQLLFPGGSLAEARKLYVESPYARTYNGLLAEAVQSAIASLPSDRRLRVLEIGAGTGGTTTYLLPLLPRDRVEYTFTDLSPHFLDRAAEQFASYPFVRYRALDIERDPVAQGFESGAYDIVVAANVLHATADIRKTLEHVRTLMASSASLFLLEGVAPERWVDLTFGLTDGWWRFTDVGLRSQYPLLARQQWMELLTTLGFSGSAALPGDEASSRAARQQALIVARGPIRRQKWTIVGDASGLPAAFAARLRQRGDSVVHVPPEAVPDTAFDADHVVYLGAVPLAEHAADDEHAVAACMARSCELPLHLLARSVRHDRPRKMWLATKGAMPVDGLMAPGARWQAPIWGVGRVFALEHPSHWGGLIDLAPDVSDDALIETLEAAIEAGDGEDQTAWRAGGRRAARLVPRSLESGSKAPFALRADATYMITGGFGGLGLIVARWMAGHGARHIALLGRTPDVTSPAIRDIEALGARVIPLRADASDEGTMTRVLRELDASAPPLRGIVHAAADLHAAPIAELTTAHIERMLRPKIAGTVVLERVTRGRELDFMVLFSSSTALLGAAGFAHYAAGNAFLDATAAAFNRPGRRVLSVNWGTWEVMRLASADSQRGFRESGLLPMPAADALEAMATLMSGEASQAMVADIDWGVLKPLHEARRARPLLSRVGLADMSDAAPVRGDATSFIDRWTGAAGDTRVEMLVEFVSREVAAVLGLHGEPVPLETGLFELGMDSLMSVELKKRLERGVGLPLPSTLTFNYPNVSALAGFIHGELQRSAANLTIEVSTVVEPAGVGEPIGDLDSLSDEELEARLLARLDGMR
jgi:malonyl CoA-acyl carrier protein transacylase/NAD(P)-dependent dehydrogenase (short-subunit alcohol dehydrogenase family)/acyl carrier protein